MIRYRLAGLLAGILLCGCSHWGQGSKTQGDVERPVVWEWAKPGNELHSPVFSPDGKSLALLCDYKGPKGSVLHVLPIGLHGDLKVGPAREAVFTPDGERLCYSRACLKQPDPQMRAEELISYQINQRKPRRLYGGCGGRLTRLIFSEDAQSLMFLSNLAILTHAPDYRLGIVNTTTGSLIEDPSSLEMHWSDGLKLEPLALSSLGVVSVCSNTDELALHLDAKSIYPWKNRAGLHPAFAVANRKVLLYDEAWKQVSVPTGPGPVLGQQPAPVASMTASPDGHLLAWSQNGENVFLASPGAAGTKVLTVQGVSELAWSTDSLQLAVICTRLDAGGKSRQVVDVIQVP